MLENWRKKTISLEWVDQKKNLQFMNFSRPFLRHQFFSVSAIELAYISI